MKNEKGSILAVVIVFIFIFTLIGMFTMRLVVTQQSNGDTELFSTRAHYAALAASELAMFHIMSWNNVDTSSYVAVNPDGRKFLAYNNACFRYDGGTAPGGKWYPAGFSSDTTDEMKKNGIPSIEVSTDSIIRGIKIETHVEEEEIANLDPKHGHIPDFTSTSPSAMYGTYKFYVIKTVASVYDDEAKTNIKARNTDELHFMIAYSSGPFGSRSTTTITTSSGVEIPALSTTTPIYIWSAPTRSFITGEILPIFRYFIRGRK